MRISVLETGHPPESLYAKYGGYGPMFETMLVPFLGDAVFTHLQIYNDHKALTSKDIADGYIITGSPFGVYEPHEWIKPLEAFVRETVRKNIPIVGICFGHQLMAQAFGGVVEKSDKGWGVGLHTYQMTYLDEGPLKGAKADLACVVSHQDQVVTLPEGASVIGGSDFCQNGIIDYGNEHALSFQMHPEFSHEFAEALLESRVGVIPKEIIAVARQSYQQPSDRKFMAEMIAHFFIKHGGQHGRA